MVLAIHNTEYAGTEANAAPSFATDWSAYAYDNTISLHVRPKEGKMNEKK